MAEVTLTPSVVLYTDGSCLGNPGPGGWAVLLRFQRKDEMHERMLDGSEEDTTNNRMELMAALQGLKALKRPCQIQLFTDSQYVKKGITEWIHNWIKNDWRNAKKKPVANADLWKQLFEATQTHQIDWRWVKAHSGHPENERVDEAARTAAETLRSALS
jgi:ribonuclease HI